MLCLFLVCWTTATLHAVVSDVRFKSLGATNEEEPEPSSQQSSSMRDVAASLVQLLKKEVGLSANTPATYTVPMAKAVEIGVVYFF